MSRYDYIIAGAGCAGLSLLMRLLEAPALREKRILLVDKAPKDRQDRTWCFWEAAPGFFEPLVHYRWQSLYIHTPEYSRQLDIAPYTYKMIRGLDFYRYCMGQLVRHPNVTVQYGEVTGVRDAGREAVLTIGQETVTADYIFSSILPQLVPQPDRQYLLQHFRGMVVRFDRPVFDPSSATLMDFRVPQEEGACFMYVLPLAPDRAMVECTFFSPSVLLPEAYERRMRDYLATHLPGADYEVEEEEQGVIPMTNHSFPQGEGRVVYLGTAGGCTKPSTGYTFQNIQAQADRLARQLAQTGHPTASRRRRDRFQFYDAVLLRVLAAGTVPAARIFGPLFRRNPPQRVLRFLENATRLPEELALVATLPVGPFLKAAVHELWAGGRRKWIITSLPRFVPQPPSSG